jgi:hypothetical protein
MLLVLRIETVYEYISSIYKQRREGRISKKKTTKIGKFGENKKEYRHSNQEKILEYQKDYRISNKENIAEKQKKS